MAEYIDRLLSTSVEKVPHKKAVIIFGARQVGKTTLLAHLFKNEKTKCFTGDSEEDIRFLTSLASTQDLSLLLAGTENIVIDEAQRIPSFGLIIKRLVDLNSSTRIFATGSSTLDLAGGVMESAAGRVRPLTLWPLSSEEIALYSSWIDVMRNLQEQLVLGSYPAILLNPDPEDAQQALMAYYESVLFKDIFSYAGIRKHPAFLRLVQILAYRIGSLSTTDSLARETGLSAKTVENYLGLMEECFIIKTLTSFSGNQANELKKSKKIYFCDLGVRNAAIANFSPFSARPSEEQGALFENFFIMERIKQHSYKNVLTQHYFWRNKAASEIDLIERNGEKLTAFEIKLNVENAKLPPAFALAYPGTEFHTVNKNNFYRYFMNQQK